jgi:hypothetical protein
MRTIAFLFVSLLLAPVVALFTIFSRRVQRSRGEVADLIDRYLDGDVSDDEWDDFTSVPIADPRLDRIRSEWIESSRDPDREREFLAALRKELRSA